jgi:hypothetical protein
MSPVLAPDPPLRLHDEPAARAPQQRDRTLEDLVLRAHDALIDGAPAECLVCGTELRARHSAGAGVVGGRCDGCGASLA